MTEGDASTRLTNAIGFETLSAAWSPFITFELSLSAGHTKKAVSLAAHFHNGRGDLPASPGAGHNAPCYGTAQHVMDASRATKIKGKILLMWNRGTVLICKCLEFSEGDAS